MGVGNFLRFSIFVQWSLDLDIWSNNSRPTGFSGYICLQLSGRKCRKCEATEETQQHLLDCTALGDNSLVLGSPRYDDLFRADTSTIGKNLQYKFKLLVQQTITPCAPLSAATAV